MKNFHFFLFILVVCVGVAAAAAVACISMLYHQTMLRLSACRISFCVMPPLFFASAQVFFLWLCVFIYVFHLKNGCLRITAVMYVCKCVYVCADECVCVCMRLYLNFLLFNLSISWIFCIYLKNVFLNFQFSREYYSRKFAFLCFCPVWFFESASICKHSKQIKQKDYNLK